MTSPTSRKTNNYKTSQKFTGTTSLNTRCPKQASPTGNIVIAGVMAGFFRSLYVVPTHSYAVTPDLPWKQNGLNAIRTTKITLAPASIMNTVQTILAFTLFDTTVTQTGTKDPQHKKYIQALSLGMSGVLHQEPIYAMVNGVAHQKTGKVDFNSMKNSIKFGAKTSLRFKAAILARETGAMGTAVTFGTFEASILGALLTQPIHASLVEAQSRNVSILKGLKLSTQQPFPIQIQRAGIRIMAVYCGAQVNLLFLRNHWDKAMNQ